jgi:hypothetical protein
MLQLLFRGSRNFGWHTKGTGTICTDREPFGFAESFVR